MERSIGLMGATGIGIGAIVGGGILALAGVAFATTGPSALIVFAINGVIAILTALSFAEMSTSFPESGGTYTFAKKVLSVRSAFVFGWVGWFASIVAGVLYALGFGAYAAILLQEVAALILGEVPRWLVGPDMVTVLAVGATLFYSFGLVRKNAGGGVWINVGKVMVFALLICGGAWALTDRSVGDMQASLTPFFPVALPDFFRRWAIRLLPFRDLISLLLLRAKCVNHTVFCLVRCCCHWRWHWAFICRCYLSLRRLELLRANLLCH